jgi:hypothetical protein
MSYCWKTGRICFSIFLLLGLAFSGCKTKPKPGSEKPRRETGLSDYERKLGLELPESANRNFFEEVAQWMGTPYRYGGSSKQGTDCSGFVQQVYLKVFGLKVDHQSALLFEKSKRIRKEQLREGDLYFFKISGNKISHVGMHLTGDFFIHASTKKGVVVNRLQEPYYAQHFVGYGTFR